MILLLGPSMNYLRLRKRTKTDPMKSKLIITIVSFFIGLASYANTSSSPQRLLADADSAYMNDNFAEAVRLYQAVIDSIGPSSEIYYNLGNSYYRAGKPGMAIVSYERALRLNPRNYDANTNLDFVNSRVIDKPGERGTLIGNVMDSVALKLQSDEWAWLAFGAFVVFLGAVALYLFCDRVILRKIGFFGGFCILLFCVGAGFFSARCAAICTSTDKAVITIPSTILSTSPRPPKDRTEEALMLHEGTSMKILDSVSSIRDSVKSTWVEVMIDNNHRAWISREAIEII